MEPSGFFWPICLAKEQQSGRIGGGGGGRGLGFPAFGPPSVLAALGAPSPSSWSSTGLATPPAAGAAADEASSAACVSA
eukprot:5690393-Lingulodinium_polyedra.AAC.1